MRFIQQFHLVIKYKKGATNKVVDMLSRSSMKNIAILGIITLLVPFIKEVFW